MSYSVRGYLQKVKRVYQEKSDEVAKKYDELKKLDADLNRIKTSHDYTPQGREARIASINTKRNALKKELDDLRSEARNEAMKLRNDAETTFYRYYNADPEDVDLKMMELIRSGIMTDGELIHYGKKANTTMRRLIGKELERRNSPELRQVSAVFQWTSENPHLKAFDQIMSIGDYAVGGAPMGGLESVKSIRARYDELVDPVINGTKDVHVEYLSDGRQLFKVE